MSDTFLLGCGAGFSGDRVDAPGPVVDHIAASPHPGGLMLETLGERTLALAQNARLRDPEAGYEPLLEQLVAPILPRCIAHGIPVVGNFGAANPEAAARAISRIAATAGGPAPRIGVVTGDDIRDRLAEIEAVLWEGEDEGTAIPREGIIAANVYLGAGAVADALGQGAEIVVTGRVADPALALGMLMHHFSWAADDWPRLAAGALAGHLAECGAQVTGGYFADPGLKDVPGMASIGFPVIEVTADGGLTVTKPPGTGGRVDTRTVKEQLLYEVHDPAQYITPDVVLDLMDVTVDQTGEDRVAVGGVRGRPATQSYKVTVSVPGGWLGEAEISYAGPGAASRARLAADTIRERLKRRGLALRTRLDLIGVASVLDDDDGSLAAAAHTAPDDVRVRLAVEAPDKREVEAATQEVLALLCCGPAGGGGLRRHHVRRIRTVSCLVAKSAVTPRIAILGGDRR
ncbi:MAG: acyclic terpene utilization AtuA family protein [Pseudomonadota bacterium]